MNNMRKFQPDLSQAAGLSVVVLGLILHMCNVPLANMVYFAGFVFFILFSKPGWLVLIALIILVTGVFFKLMHWLGGMLIILGALIAGTVAGLINYLLKDFSLERMMIFISLCILASGIYLKVRHIHQAREFLVIGFSFLLLSYFYRFYRKDNKNFEDILKLLLVLSCCLSGIFNGSGSKISWIFGSLMIVFALVWLAFTYIRLFGWTRLTRSFGPESHRN